MERILNRNVPLIHRPRMNFVGPDGSFHLKSSGGLVTDDLQVHYKFDEGSGTTLGDSAGTAEDGTIQGATWTTDGGEDVLDFDGTNDYVDCDTWDFSGGNYTFQIAVKPPSGPNFNYIDIESGRLLLANSDFKVSYFDGSFHQIADDDALVWQILTWKFSGSTGEIFRGKTSLGTDSYSSKSISDRSRIATRFTADNNWMDGQMAYLLLYDRALSTSEIEQNVDFIKDTEKPGLF